MREGGLQVGVLAFLSFLCLAAITCPAIAQIYIEDFTTTQYRNALNTTALWDTVAGELKLFPFTPTLAGNYATSDYSLGITISGDFAFVTLIDVTLQVIDISDPTNPTLAGSIALSDVGLDLTVSGAHAFVAVNNSGLLVIDISDPTNPTLAGTCDTPGTAWGIAVTGNHAFVADDGSGLQVIDISDPTAPTLLGTYDTAGYARSVTVSGDYAFVADDVSGLQVIDISDPAAPTLSGNYDTAGNARSVTVSGDYAFVADHSSGLQVIDISNPAAPTLSGNYDTPGTALDVIVSGDYAFVADHSSGLQVIDISDPTAPTLSGNYDTPGFGQQVAVSGNHAYLADYSSGLQVIAISDPIYPTLLGNFVTGQIRDVAVSGDHAFVADYRGLRIVDISDPTDPTLLGSYNAGADGRCVAVSGDYALLAANWAHLKIIDISDPTDPTQLGVFHTWSDARWGLAVSGDYAFVLDWNWGLQVVDISDPTNPTLAGTFITSDYPLGVNVSGDYAFVTNISQTLQVIDISDPTYPTLAGFCAFSDVGFDLTVSGNHVFVAANNIGLLVIDISDPTNPTLAGSCDTPGAAWGIDISGNYAYVGDYGSGLTVIDISDPTDPTVFGNYDTPSTARGIAVSGEYAFVADYDSGLQVVQVFQSEVDQDNNIGQSLSMYALSDTIFGARLTTVQTDSVAWELSADGGMNWKGVVPDGSWNQMIAQGTDLLWRSTHSWASHRVNPGVIRIEIEYLGAVACIDSIVDVPDDQGRSLNLSFTRSGYDFPSETLFPIVGYAIYRRLDEPGLAQKVMNQPAVSKDHVLDHPQLASLGIDRVRMLEDRFFIVGGSSAASDTLPPGVWEEVGWVLPEQIDSYSLQVSTLSDSSASGMNWSVFVTAVQTSTPEILYISEPDSGYSVDNIAPDAPQGLAVAYNTGSGNGLSWDPAPETDFQHYRVYRGDSETFTPGPGNLVAQTTTPAWTDPEYDGWDVHYKITTLDLAGNESDAASPATTTGDELPSVPNTFALYQNNPNPFNPVTTIRFDLPKASHVKLSVFNVKGELVSTIADRHMSEGHKEFIWTAVDGRERAVSSSIYFYRLVAGDFVQTRKMVLLR